MPVSFLLWIASKNDAPRAAERTHEAHGETGEEEVNRLKAVPPS
ncbi:MAG: hypothetical protein ACUVTY_14375 [Armatimonadota bacterium]